MRAKLLGLDGVPWDRLHSNTGAIGTTRVPTLLRQCARAKRAGGFRAGRSPWYLLDDALCHQGTRFGGAAEALPFILELVAADETLRRVVLFDLARRIGAPVGPLEGVPFDRKRLARLSASELWENEDVAVIDGYASMCAHDARARWLSLLPTVALLAHDPDPKLRHSVREALAESDAAPPGQPDSLGTRGGRYDRRAQEGDVMAVKKSASRQTSAKKKPAKKAAPKKALAKKKPAKKAAPKKAPARKAVAKKAPAKKAAPKKAVAKKKPAKKVAPKKVAPKKGAAKQAPGPTAAQRALYTTALAGKTINDLKAMLRANDQLTGGTRGELVDRVVDRVVNGNLPRCPQCFVGRLRVNARGRFSCPGGYDDDEYQECSFTGAAGSIERPAWQVQMPGGVV